MSEDERYFVVKGRRWRRTDPGVPEKLRAELVKALMRARREVGVAKRAGDAAAERLARDHVGEAKLALGERGPKWWEELSDAKLRPRMAATARALLWQRGDGKTICPSDVARVVGGQAWRRRMEAARRALVALVHAGELEVRQRGRVVAPDRAQGPIRFARKV